MLTPLNHQVCIAAQTLEFTRNTPQSQSMMQELLDEAKIIQDNAKVRLDEAMLVYEATIKNTRKLEEVCHHSAYRPSSFLANGEPKSLSDWTIQIRNQIKAERLEKTEKAKLR